MARRWIAALIALPLLYLATPDPMLAGTITRCTKTSAGGGTEFADNTTIEAAEVNCDFNALFNLVNGSLDGDNVSGIPWSKITGTKDPEDIDDTSATRAEMDVDKDPGDASSLNLATDLEDELQHLRRQVKRLVVGETVVRRDTSGAASNEDVAWYELAARGPNLLPNGSLDIYTGDSTSQDAPDGWTKTATPSTLEPVSLSTAEGEGQAIHIVSDASSEGIVQTLDGLKGSTRYLLQVKAKVASGSFTVTTDHSDGTTWDDASRTITGSSYDVYGFVLVMDASATDLDVNLLSDASGDDFTIAWVSLRELADVPITEDPQVSDAMFAFTQLEADVAATGSYATINGTTSNGAATDVSAAVTVPDYGTWSIEVDWAFTGRIDITAAAGNGTAGYRISVTGGLTTTWPAGSIFFSAASGDQDDMAAPGSGRRFVFPATNGSTYTFALQHRVQGSAGTRTLTTKANADGSVGDGGATHISARVVRAW